MGVVELVYGGEDVPTAPGDEAPAMPTLTAAQLAQRRPLWSAMSDLFLDTETRWSVPWVGAACCESGLDDATLEGIFWAEVFPLAIPNLHDIAGEWGVLELPESMLVARAEAPHRDRVAELTSAWMVKHTWDASLVICRRLRTEPATRHLALRRAWDAFGRRFLEHLGRTPFSDLQKPLLEARAGGVDLEAEWRFYAPLLEGLAIGGEAKELAMRAQTVRELLDGLPG